MPKACGLKPRGTVTDTRDCDHAAQKIQSYHNPQITPPPQAASGREVGVMCLKPMESKARVGNRNRAAQKAPEGDDTQTYSDGVKDTDGKSKDISHKAKDLTLKVKAKDTNHKAKDLSHKANDTHVHVEHKPG